MLRAAITAIAFVAFGGCAGEADGAITWQSGQEDSADSQQVPTVCVTQDVEFLGSRFARRFTDTSGAVHGYEYLADGDELDNWWELAEFQSHPPRGDGVEPMRYAAAVARKFRQDCPQMRYALYAGTASSDAYLDVFFPASTCKDKDRGLLEFHAFEFFSDPGTGRSMSLHYARNIEGVSASRPSAAVAAEIKKTRTDVLAALAGFAVYCETSKPPVPR